ncbi:MAG: hypothetical protein ABUS56_07065 [Acidobacteriota bacterium]
MKAFRFRAAGALELRRRQEDAARITFARADLAQRIAEQRVRDASAAAVEGRTKLGELQQGSAPAWLLGWHQSWMSRQRLELHERERELGVATEASAAATAALRLAYRRRRVLERWRERAWRMYLVEVRRHDAREMDQLAGLRYGARFAEAQGAASEHEPHH